MVIADLGMPDMPGDTLLTRMLEIRPDLRILVCSGSPFFIENLPSGHPSTAIARARLGHVLVLEKQYTEAEEHLLAGYEVLTKQPGPQASRLQTARTDLATVYEALNRPDQASKFRAELAANAPNQQSSPTKQ